MKKTKRWLACLVALLFLLSAVFLAGCQFRVSSGPESGSSGTEQGGSSGGSGGSGGSPGGDPSVGQDLDEALKQAFELDGVRGLSGSIYVAESSSILAGGDTEEGASGSGGMLSVTQYIEGQAALHEDGTVDADIYTIGESESESERSETVYGAYVRGIDAYGGGGDVYVVSAGDVIDGEASLAENAAAVRQYVTDGKESIVFSCEGERMLDAFLGVSAAAGETRQDFLAAFAVLLGAVEQIPACFEGEAAETADGYTLSYRLKDCADVFYKGIFKGVLQAADEDADMTWAEFAELPQIVALTDCLFADSDAEEMYGLLRITLKNFMVLLSGESVDAFDGLDFTEILPAPGKTQSGAEYLRACVGDLHAIMKKIMTEFGDLDEDTEAQIDGMTPRVALSAFLSEIFGVFAEEGEKMSVAFDSWYEEATANWEKYGKEASLVLSFDGEKVPTGLSLCIEAENAAADPSEGFAFSLDCTLEFSYELPALLDLTGYTCQTGTQIKNAVYEGDLTLTDWGGTVSYPWKFRVEVRENGRELGLALYDEAGQSVWEKSMTENDTSGSMPSFACKGGKCFITISPNFTSSGEDSWFISVLCSVRIEGAEPIPGVVAELTGQCTLSGFEEEGVYETIG